VTNYLPDLNRFALAGPPAWFLKKLWEFDSSLVIIPSRQTCVYRLAQRRPLKLPDKMVNESLFKESDTKMLASYGLIPVTSIIPTIEWADPYIFLELERRAPHRMGGADKAIEAVEQQEQKNELLKRAKTDEMLNYLAKDAWGMYNKNLGTRSHMYIPKTRQDIVGGSKAPSFRVKQATPQGGSLFVA